MKLIPLRLTRKGQPVFDTPERPAYLPAQLMVKVKPDVVEGFPDLTAATVAMARSFRLPNAVEGPIANLRRKGLIEQVIPVFAEAPLAAPARAKAKARGAAAARGAGAEAVSSQPILDIRIPAVAFARSVREVPDADLRGINLLRLSPKANLTQVLKDLKASRGVEYCHLVPARWPAKANAMLNRQWGLRATHWFENVGSGVSPA